MLGPDLTIDCLRKATMPDLIVHFLNVAHGDCTIIKHPSGRLSIIDTSNGEEIDKIVVEAKLRQDYSKRLAYQYAISRGYSPRRALKEAGIVLELTNPVKFLNDNYPGEEIFRYIQTHPELDHMRGLAALQNTFTLSNFWDTANHRSLTPRASDQEDWDAYQRLRSGSLNRNFTRGDKGVFFTSDKSGGPGDNITILSPSAALVASNDSHTDKGGWNEMSFVLKVTHGRTSLILGGDAAHSTWDDILANCKSQLPCSVLKASHHGRESGYHRDAIIAMAPTATILSIADECEHEAREEYVGHCGKHVYSTYERGTMTFTFRENGEITYKSER